MNSEFKAVGGHWAAVSVDAAGDGQVAMHVGVSVAGYEEFGEADLDLSLWAGDRQLEAIRRPGAGELIFVETKAITAIGQFAFANPENSALSVAQVTLLGESVVYDVSNGDTEPPLVA